MLLNDVIIARNHNNDVTDEFQKELIEFNKGLKNSYLINIYYDYDNVQVRVDNASADYWEPEIHSMLCSQFGLKLGYFEKSHKQVKDIGSSYALFKYYSRNDENVNELPYDELFL